MPACDPTAAAPQTVAQVAVAGHPAWLEGLAIDAKGRAFVSSPYTGQVFRIDDVGAQPRALTPARLPIDPSAITGGLTFLADGRLVAVTGVLPPASLLPLGKVVEIDPDTGRLTTVASGILGGNGIAEGPDGSLYVSSSTLGAVQKIAPDGRLTRVWAAMLAPNGVALSADGEHVYVSQTLSLTRSAVRRVSVRTGASERWLDVPGSNPVPLVDGLMTDPRGHLVMATGLAGQLWRVEPSTRAVCTLEPGERTPATQAAYGRGDVGFRSGHLYRVGETGLVQEVPAGQVD